MSELKKYLMEIEEAPICTHFAHIPTLLKIIEKQAEAIEFYGNQKNWDYTACGQFLNIKKDDYPEDYNLHIGGKRARACQSDIEKMIGEKKSK